MKFFLTRRQWMITAGGLGFASVISPSQFGSCDEAEQIAPNPADLIARLKEGNQRFVNGKPKHHHTNREWRTGLVGEQNPFAVILGCADSRVPTELIFDQGFGDLFVIRNAGNVVMEDVAGSIEYAALHLGTQLVVIMGHEGCGAVTAALSSREERAKEPPELQKVLRLIDPALVQVDPQGENVLIKAVEANVGWSVKNLSRIHKQRKHPNTKNVAIVGAIYELKTGRVRFLSDSQLK